jgi:hypothetical protein
MLSVEIALVRTAFVEIHVRVMRSGITLRSPPETEQQSSESAETSQYAEDELLLSVKPSFSACDEQTVRQAKNSHRRHKGNASAKPGFSKAAMAVNILDSLASFTACVPHCELDSHAVQRMSLPR